jgi:hypothetical protein
MHSPESPQVPAFCGDVKMTSPQLKPACSNRLEEIAGTCGDSGGGRPYTCARVTRDLYIDTLCSRVCERGKESPQVPANVPERRQGMVTDQQVRRLRKLSNTEKNQEIAASKAGMDPKTARKYLAANRLPSEMKFAPAQRN